MQQNLYLDILNNTYISNTKILISWQQRNIIFSLNKENSLITNQVLLYDKEQFYTGGNL